GLSRTGKASIERNSHISPDDRKAANSEPHHIGRKDRRETDIQTDKLNKPSSTRAKRTERGRKLHEVDHNHLGEICHRLRRKIEQRNIQHALEHDGPKHPAESRPYP